MNKLLVILLVSLVCGAAATVYLKPRYHKTHLGGAAYAYRPIVYRKPVLHHPAPIVYAHKSHSKPRTVHYVKPAYHHEVPHYAPVYHSKPVVYYLGGHAGHGLVHKPSVYGHGHGLSYHHKGH